MPQVRLSRPSDEVEGEQGRLVRSMRFKIGRVEEGLIRSVETNGAVHLTLIDPDAQSPAEAGRMAEAASKGDSDALMVGGSTGASGSILEETVRQIKDRTELPVILFPSSAAGLCQNADAVFFMSLLNSRSTSYIVDNQALGAPLVSRYGLEPLPMAYLIVEPGGTVGWVGDARVIQRKKPEIAAAYALAGKFFGMRMVYLEAGSGAESPVPLEMVSTVKKAVGDSLLLVGGGIRDGRVAASLVESGADIIVTGTAVEKTKDVTSFVLDVTRAIRCKSG
jgi:phosphoglycerol geranylgeranyltransferase